jgi:hypothetical protein
MNVPHADKVALSGAAVRQVLNRQHASGSGPVASEHHRRSARRGSSADWPPQFRGEVISTEVTADCDSLAEVR